MICSEQCGTEMQATGQCSSQAILIAIWSSLPMPGYFPGGSWGVCVFSFHPAKGQTYIVSNTINSPLILLPYDISLEKPREYGNVGA